MSGLRAVIDLGSNTAKVLVAKVSDSNLEVVLEESRYCRLGEAVDRSGLLGQEAMERTLQALSELSALAQKAGASKPVVYATSAMRSSTNGTAYAAEIGETLKLEVVILSGEQEAEAVFRGVSSDPALQGRDLIVMDLGGGSAEFIVGTAGTLLRKASYELGCVRMTERFLKQFPVTQEDREALGRHVLSVLQGPMFDLTLSGHTLVGTGGTMTTLALLEDSGFWTNARSGKGFVMSLSQLRERTKSLAAMSLEELRNLTGVPAKRADILVAGAITHLTAFELLGADTFHISNRGLRYGLILGSEDLKPASSF